MLPDIGSRLGGLPRELTLVRELEAFDGPILSEYHAAEGAGVYIEKWCACDNATNRFLVVRSDQRAIAEYLGGRRTLINLLRVPSDDVGFLVDRGGGRTQATFLVSVSRLPKQYLPDATAYHDESLRPHWEVVPQNFLLDADWDANLLAHIEKSYQSAYGFTWVTEPKKARRLPASVLNFEFDGGFPIMHANTHIRAAVPKESRARSASVSAGSPGVLTIDAPAETANRLAAALNALPKAEFQYKNLHSWCRLSPKKVSRQPTLLPKSSIAIGNIEALCTVLGVDHSTLLPTVPDEQPDQAMAILVAGKLIAAHYRRLWRLLDVNGGFEFVSARSGEQIPDDVYDDEDEADI